MNIPFVDLKEQYLSIKGDIDNAIQNVISETAFIGGKYVKKFESEFAELYGVKNCIAVANGTDSLYIIMKMLGVKEGDEVITSAYSWISSSETISQTGATPVFVDISADYYTIDETQIEKYITNRTKAIIPVHIHGQVCNMDAILSIAEKYNLYVIEDCAQSHFSEFNGKRAGTMGIASSFSFYPGKNLGAYGDAGCILTNDDELADKFRMFANHGALKKHQHQIEGINSRLDGLQAAILSAKLPHIINWTDKRKKCANVYFNILNEIDQVTCPKIRPNSEHSFHLFLIKVDRRDELHAFLKENGVETVIHYPKALTSLACYGYLNLKQKDYPVATGNETKILSLPIYPELSLMQIERITDLIKEFFDNEN
jgi:dTDP-4-amino-4,6-dideoxygalactose transaminase